ncbi:sugar ABC transporter ATP-binding protein [Herbiconiux flava]|uniref:Autoinducer 2 import ATP-binding protein LsrA n=1 Tax=Herbiconiux flava TaxID=881268 RepID=A0A852SMN2_9MICO|nr:sugar ABC transporter ATP-binding protein [Herbiconiux flava]NYD70064.1 simple sugar transport system ATP-binding protein [Herbiconiux flava]GLK16814.1 sugar ABC transporter ATP-binding protein [Herbiconiux flava]
MTDSRSEHPGGHDAVVSPVGVPAALPVVAAPDAVVSLSGVSVAYGSNVVLQGVDLAFGAGEITALLGANGAGKSTLIKALSGANARYGGEIRIGDDVVHLSSPVQARQLGISTVHQKVADGIVPGLSVAENLTLDDLAQASRHPLRRRRQALADARAALGTLGLDWSDAVLERDAATLPISDAQLLVLARALRSTPRLLILDEPTSALTAAEAERLFGVLRALRAQGLSIVYVSHRFGEIEALADRVVVLRDGLVQSVSARPFAWHELLHDMLGRQTALENDRGTAARGTDAVARLDGVVALPDAPPIDLEIRRGEVLGVLGLIGAGKTELAELLGGLAQPLAGTLTLEGAPYAPKRPSDAIRAGVVLVPEDRQKQGILPGWSVLRNITLPFLAESSALGLLRRRSERSRADTVIDTLSVVTAGPDALIDDLSGGNQQKVVVGRWLSAAPKLALLDEPFRGVDIAARREIGARLAAIAADGAAAVVFSSDVDEILEVADRIVVLVAGRIELDRYADTVDRPTIIHAFLGETASAPAPSGPAAAPATTHAASPGATPTSSTPESRPERTSS